MPKKPKTVKTRRRLNKNIKFQKRPKSHICQRQQKTENNAEETKPAMKLKKIKKAKKNKVLKNEIRQKTPKKSVVQK